jgi:hypothetical protein
MAGQVDEQFHGLQVDGGDNAADLDVEEPGEARKDSGKINGVNILIF